jgi:hypothetical protein
MVRHGRSIAFQMAEVAVSRALFQEILAAIVALGPPAAAGPMLRTSAPGGRRADFRQPCAQSPALGSNGSPFDQTLHRDNGIDRS